MSAFWPPSVLCRENPGGRNYLESGISNGHAIKTPGFILPRTDGSSFPFAASQAMADQLKLRLPAPKN